MIDLEDPILPDKQRNLLAESASGDPITAYLELALRIYLRIKNEGRTIHNPQFDDHTDHRYDHPANDPGGQKIQ